MLLKIMTCLSIFFVSALYEESADRSAHINSEGRVLMQRHTIFRGELTSSLDDVPKIIHQTWVTDLLPQAFQVWSKTWKECLPDWEYKLHTDEDNREIFKKHFPELLETYDGYGQNIRRVDAARLAYMATEGGLYVDLDIECLKDPRSVLNLSASFVLVRHHQPDLISNAFMMSSPSSMGFFREMISKLPETKNEELVGWATGPQFWTWYGSQMLEGDWKTHPGGTNSLAYTRDGVTHTGIMVDDSLAFVAHWADGEMKSKALNRDWILEHYPNSFSYSHWTGSWQGIPLPSINESSVRELHSEHLLRQNSFVDAKGFFIQPGVCQCVLAAIAANQGNADVDCTTQIRNGFSIREPCTGRACWEKLVFGFRDNCI